MRIEIPDWMKRRSQPRVEADGRSAHKIVVIDGKATLALSQQKPKQSEVRDLEVKQKTSLFLSE